MNQTSSFAAWQEANQVRRESIVSDYLSFLAKTRVKVRNVTDLADLVARHISEVEGKPCNKATLLRNKRYKARILTYQAKSQAPGTRALSARAVADPLARALLTGAQLDSGNLKRELERLKIYTTALEKQFDQLKNQTRIQPDAPVPTERLDRLTEAEFRFVRTCQALWLLVNSFNSIVQLDPSGRRILDMSKRRNNVIVDQEVAGPFFDWLKTQSGKTTDLQLRP